ncbi:MAG: hypothetical protein U9Q08_02000 [Candidatus Omnitrophota bacterium]|nr:hypothetical protein [Candidatus Omnitrophota bacterium]
MKKTLLIIGDRKTKRGKLDPSLKQFIKHAEKPNAKRNFNLKVIAYQNVLTGKLPEINEKYLIIMLFFPFEHWNKQIEVYDQDKRAYGDQKFGSQFSKFFIAVEKILTKKYRNKKIRYVNPPQSCILDRDKAKTKSLLLKNNIPVPNAFAVSNPRAIEDLIKEGKSLYLKPRFGAMGKGITYVSGRQVVTNFLFRQDRIISRPYDYNWRFSRISNKKRFLKKLLSKDVICEEAIEPATHEGRRFDFRIYTIYGRTPYFYAKSVGENSIVTNWSQGGRIEKKKSFYQHIPKSKIRLMLSLAKKTARTLGLNYAGVDILFSKGFEKIYVLEAHSFPAHEKGFNLTKFLSEKI